ncbi:uncharacterized protein [Setaria viridis]
MEFGNQKITVALEEEDLDCLEPKVGDIDIYEDDEARVFHERDTNGGLLKDKGQSSCTRVETTQVDRYKRMPSRIVGGGAEQDNYEEIDGENDGGYGDNDYGNR